MVSVHAQVARKYEYPLPPPVAPGTLFKVFEQSEEQLAMARLNLKLQDECGEEFQVRFYSGDQLDRIPRSILRSAAQCYADVFNESWGEDWTLESAMQEIRSVIDCDPGYTPVMTLLFHEEKVVGFSWGFIMDRDSLTEDSQPFSSSSFKRHESVTVARYWLDQVARCGKLISVRELGVLKEFRNDKTPYLCLPIFERAEAEGCKAAFLRTKVTSKAFKWSLGIGFVPLQLFMVNDLLLMHGSVKYAANTFRGMIDASKKRQSQQNVVNNIKRYLCQF